MKIVQILLNRRVHNNYSLQNTYMGRYVSLESYLELWEGKVLPKIPHRNKRSRRGHICFDSPLGVMRSEVHNDK